MIRLARDSRFRGNDEISENETGLIRDFRSQRNDGIQPEGMTGSEYEP